jgi:hypothetical protein
MTTQARVAELEQRHHELEKEIAEALKHKSIDDLEIVELKRQKLHLKDEIQEANMAKDTKSAEDLSAVAGQTIEQARGAMENYLDFFQKSMSGSPWAGAELNKKVTDYAQQNVAAAFGFAQQLTQAKDLQDVVRIQTEFLQTQMKSLTEQAEDLSETATKATMGALKGVSS